MDLDHLRSRAAAGAISIADLGPVEDWAELFARLASDPILVPAVAAATSWLESADQHGPAADVSFVAAAVAEAIAATAAPAVFRDAAEAAVASPTFIQHTGDAFARTLIRQAQLPDEGAEAASVLRAADALDISTDLCLGGWGPELALFAALDDAPGGSDARYQRAVIRSVVACREQWADTTKLTGAIRRIGDIDADLAPGIQGDVGVALARLAMIDALRAPDAATALEHLAGAGTSLHSVLEFDDRIDAVVTSLLIGLLTSLIESGTMDPPTVDRLVAAVREHQHFASGTSHWAGDRTAAVGAAWAQLSIDFRAAVDELAKPSWYTPCRVIDDIIDLYRTTRSRQIYARSADGEAIGTVIAPVLADGFAERNALLSHLDDHVRFLQQRAESGDATERELVDLPVALELREHARTRLEDLERKRGAGAAESPGGSSEPPAESPSLPDMAAELRNVVTAQRLRSKATGSITGDLLLEAISAGFATSDAYTGIGRDAADLVAHLLVTFVVERSRLGPAEIPYLFDAGAEEADLAKDLYSYVVAQGRLGDVRVEVQKVAGGRVDLEFAFPGFNLVVELKVDSTAKPLGDKPHYLRQTVAYQVESINLGFLLVLKLLKAPAVPLALVDCLEMIDFDDESGAKRFVAAMTVSGAKKVPSRL